MEMRKNGTIFTKQYHNIIRKIYIIEMLIKLSKIINFPLRGKFNLKLGIKLLNIPQFFSYLLFNKLYQKRIRVPNCYYSQSELRKMTANQPKSNDSNESGACRLKTRLPN